MPKDHLYRMTVTWTGAEAGPTRDYATYSRQFAVQVEGKPALEASSDPTWRGQDHLHNPEDLLLAALAGCHLLSYLALCARARIPVARYVDQPEGTLAYVKGSYQFTRVVLRPDVSLVPDADHDAAARAIALHQQAHELCFIARSVNFAVTCEPRISPPRGTG
jgi:organic hydroperoxide reductase OsmC/OhrA